MFEPTSDEVVTFYGDAAVVDLSIRAERDSQTMLGNFSKSTFLGLLSEQ